MLRNLWTIGSSLHSRVHDGTETSPKLADSLSSALFTTLPIWLWALSDRTAKMFLGPDTCKHSSITLATAACQDRNEAKFSGSFSPVTPVETVSWYRTERAREKCAVLQRTKPGMIHCPDRSISKAPVCTQYDASLSEGLLQKWTVSSLLFTLWNYATVFTAMEPKNSWLLFLYLRSFHFFLSPGRLSSGQQCGQTINGRLHYFQGVSFLPQSVFQVMPLIKNFCYYTKWKFKKFSFQTTYIPSIHLCN